MIQIPESIIKRNDQRQEGLQKKKVEGPSQADVFRETFKEKQIHIENVFASIEDMKDRNKLAETFNEISKELIILNKYLSTSSLFLIPYDIKISKNILQELQDKSSELERKLLPKKKFGFSNRKDIKINVEKKKEEELPEKNITEKETIKCGFSDQKGQKLFLNHIDVENQDVVLSHLENCDLVINGGPNTMHLVSIHGCRIISGPVTTSVLLEDCKDSVLAFPCQQLRIHNSTASDFYIHVTTKAIIEDSKQLRFAPYNYNYEEINEHYIKSGLDRGRNNWDLVDDFNWLVSNKQSPNWNILPENERIQL